MERFKGDGASVACDGLPRRPPTYIYIKEQIDQCIEDNTRINTDEILSRLIINHGKSQWKIQLNSNQMFYSARIRSLYNVKQNI
jgi:hypothetical protein